MEDENLQSSREPLFQVHKLTAAIFARSVALLGGHDLAPFSNKVFHSVEETNQEEPGRIPIQPGVDLLSLPGISI
jgi:hypothetical protein